MARELRKQEVADAVKAYAAKAGKEVSLNESGGMCIMPGDVLVSCESGRLECNDPATKEALAEILMDMPQEARSPENKATMIRKTAVVSGHREAFPGDTSGMYGSEELGIDPEMEVKT